MTASGVVAICVQCPVCLGSDFEHVAGLFRAPDHPLLFRRDPNRHVVMCARCGTLQRSPLEVRSTAAAEQYGEAYYDQFADRASWEASVRGHIQYQQMHYEQLRAVLHEWTSPTKHRRWLDVGSAGCPTVFNDFDFQTVEPDRRVVELGRTLFAPARIHCGVIETFEADAPFDGIVFHDSFYCIPSPNAALARARALLRSGGLLLFRMGGPFMQTRDNAQDGQYHRLEDALRGDVKWVDYCVASLGLLCSRHGFAYRTDVEKPQAYAPCRTARYVLFEKGDVPIDGPRVEQTRALQREILENVLTEIRERTERSLALFDRQDVAIIGPLGLLLDLRRARPGLSPGAFVDTSFPDAEASFTMDGACFTNLRALAEKVRAGSVRYILVASLTQLQETTRAVMQALPSDGLDYFVPSRQAGEDRLFGEFRSKLMLVRGLVGCSALPAGKHELSRGAIVTEPLGGL